MSLVYKGGYLEYAYRIACKLVGCTGIDIDRGIVWQVLNSLSTDDLDAVHKRLGSTILFTRFNPVVYPNVVCSMISPSCLLHVDSCGCSNAYVCHAASSIRLRVEV